MTAGEPYLALRDFRVHFVKRRGFFEALRRTEEEPVRAVDGLDLDIRKGEVYCLVGESGCGKTTTGKGILRLVEPTGGDVLFGMPPDAMARFDAARTRGETSELDALRRRWSLTYREDRPWNRGHTLFFLFAASCGTILYAGLAAGVISLLELAGGPLLALLGPVLPAILLGYLVTRPPVKTVHNLPRYAVPFAAAGTAFAVLAAAALGNLYAGAGADAGTVVRTYVARGDLYLLVVFPLQVLVGILSVYAATGRWVHRSELASGLEGGRLRRLRRHLQMIFQDPYEYLNPKHSVYDIVAEPLVVNRLAKGRAETEARVRKALHDAGLRPAEDFMYRYPHELSGGQRQRVSIASALILEPDFIVADEPVSMLDVSIRTEILELLLELRRDRGLTYLFITHDLSLAWVLADRIAVMYLGKIVEEGPTHEVIKNPRHPYTQALISVVPVPNPRRRHRRIILKGERPDPSDIPPGCRFHPRCPVAFDKCGWTSEELADELRSLNAATSGSPAPVMGMREDGRLTLDLSGDPDALEAWLRASIATRSETSRSLKAVRSVERLPSGLRVRLHGFDEPALLTVAPDLRVACHLVG